MPTIDFPALYPMPRIVHATVFAVFAALLILPQPGHASAPDDDRGGQMRAVTDDGVVQFPVLKTDIRADISGAIATVTVDQTFANPTSTPLNATYLFPLNRSAAVHAMEMRVGDEVISAMIQRREEARRTFNEAKSAGKAAALLEQHRPNMFTQSVANLMPGQPVKVTLKYVQAVPRVDGAYRLVLPLVVGPRYIPNDTPMRLVRNETEPKDAAGSVAKDTPAGVGPQGVASGQWSLGPVPDYPKVAGLTIPKLIDADRVSIRVDVRAGIPIASILSSTHAIAAEGEDAQRTVTLAPDRTIDNRDFILDYRLGGDGVATSVLTHRDATGGYLSVMLEPPADVSPDQVTPREIVFVLDTSGSMGGAPIAASKAFMRQALAALTPNDYFRIIRFANNASEFTHAPVRATPGNVEQGRRYVDSLAASGGTEVIPALSQAFGMAQTAGTKRMIVFLSDGYVGNEQEILRMVAGNIGRTRTYVLGVGTAVNRYLLAEMAHQGRGFMRIIDPTEKVEDAAAQFASRLSTTVMTDLSIDWGALKVSDVAPVALPDLFQGDSLRIYGRFVGSGTHRINIKGKINGRDAVMPVDVQLPGGATGEETRAIPLTWARATIADEMRQLMRPSALRSSGRSDEAIRERITTLGLTHALVTQWTSFVAVSRRIVNQDPSSARDSDVPLPMVKGIGPEAYGKSTIQASRDAGRRFVQVNGLNPGQSLQAIGGTFAGGATPEPEHLIGLMVMILGLAAGFIRRRSS